MDLFPESTRPEIMGFSAVTLMAACFFALYPDGAARTKIAELQRQECERLRLPRDRWRPPQLFHVSVATWGKARRLRCPLEDALRIAKERFNHPAFDVSLTSSTRFSAQRDGFALVLEADARTAWHVRSLRNDLADAQLHAGLVAARGSIRPHATLAYASHIPDQRVSMPPIVFRARSVHLVISQPGTRTHHLLDSWDMPE